MLQVDEICMLANNDLFVQSMVPIICEYFACRVVLRCARILFHLQPDFSVKKKKQTKTSCIMITGDSWKSQLFAQNAKKQTFLMQWMFSQAGDYRSGDL